MNALPLIRSIPFRPPAAAFAPLAAAPMSMLLESANVEARGGSGSRTGTRARYSYIVAAPFSRIHCTAYPWQVTIDGRPHAGNAFAAVKEALARFRRDARDDALGPVPFLGGAVGFFSYELGGMLERLPPPKTRPFPADMVAGLYDVVAAFDHRDQAAWIISTGFPESGAAQVARAHERADELEAKLGKPLGPAVPQGPLRGIWVPETSRAEYESRVASALEAIRAGEIYQANLTQRFWAEWTEARGVPPFDLYRRLRAASPAPFAAFVNASADENESMALISVSPERFLALDAEGLIETRPIKGTRPRGRDPEEDRALASELLASAKDRAENLMIVDLLRNDLARASRAGSVSVQELCALESFPAVHHLVSTITGRLRPGLDAVDLLGAAFPGGSITGAPKIQAMKIIHALEPSARGPYCGSIAWMGFNGAMDSSIVIRTLVYSTAAHGGARLAAQAGGGIVADSDPGREYEESMTKVRPLLAVLDGPVIERSGP